MTPYECMVLTVIFILMMATVLTVTPAVILIFALF
jgi:hypothetical protein